MGQIVRTRPCSHVQELIEFQAARLQSGYADETSRSFHPGIMWVLAAVKVVHTCHIRQALMIHITGERVDGSASYSPLALLSDTDQTETKPLSCLRIASQQDHSLSNFHIPDREKTACS